MNSSDALLRSELLPFNTRQSTALTEASWTGGGSPVHYASLAPGKGSLTVNSSQNLWTLWKSKNTTGHKSICCQGQNLRLRPRQVLPLVLLQGKAIKLPQYHCGHPSTTWSAPLVINNSWPYQSRPLRMGQNPYPWYPPSSDDTPSLPTPTATRVLLLQNKSCFFLKNGHVQKHVFAQCRVVQFHQVSFPFMFFSLALCEVFDQRRLTVETETCVAYLRRRPDQISAAIPDQRWRLNRNW